MRGANSGLKLSKNKVVLTAWFAITLIVLLFLQLKPNSTISTFISIEKVSSDHQHNASSRRNIKGSTSHMLMTSSSSLANVSHLEGLGGAGKVIIKNNKLKAWESSCVGYLNAKTNQSCISNTNPSGKSNKVTSRKDDQNQRPDRSKDQFSPANKDSVLLASSTTLLDYPRPEYLPGYKSPCFNLEMGQLNSLIEETWKQNSALASTSHLKVNSKDSTVLQNPPDPVVADSEEALPAYPKANLKYSKLHGKVSLCLPGFFLVGIRKSGTSDLAYKLMKHKQIYSGTKEGHFFDSLTTPQCSKFVFRRWSYNLLQYLALLKWDSVGEGTTYDVKLYNGSLNLGMMTSDEQEPYGKYTLLGDYTPAYSTKVREVCTDTSTMNFETPAKIKHLVPDAKIIFILRDPVSRASSDIRYAMLKNINLKTPNLLENIHSAFVQAIRWWRKCTSQHGEYSYECVFGTCWNLSANEEHYIRALRNGIYYGYVHEYLRVFSPSQVLVVDTGVYSSDPIQYIEEQVLPFLGLPPYDDDLKEDTPLGKEEKSNKNTAVNFQLLEKTQVLLQKFYRPYNKKLSDLLAGRRFSWFQDV